jgi:hypothetical protein
VVIFNPLSIAPAPYRVAAVAVVLAFAPLAVRAQALPRLHITQLAMRADTNAVAPGESFRVTIHVHVSERRERLDELVLPSLTNVIDLGDERRRVASPAGGTDFYEIMTVAASETGVASFSPAYIDAIDPASGRAMRYSSQPLTVAVVAGDAPAGTVARTLAHLVQRLVGWAVAAVVVFFAAAYLAGRLRRRRREPEFIAPAPSAPLERAPAPDPVRAALAAFRAAGDDASLDAVRSALFERAGAGPGATFADALTALGGRDPALAHVLSVAERARFGPDHEREPAAHDLIALLEDYLDAEPVG